MEYKDIPKVLLSSGVGSLHFYEAAKSLNESDKLDPTLITGFIPSGTQSELLKKLFSILGKADLSNKIDSRLALSNTLQTKQCVLPEILSQAIPSFTFRVQNKQWDVGALSMLLHGFLSRSFVDGFDVFHVRSGAGRGGCIQRAKSQGAKVVVDHSILHPDHLGQILNPLYQKRNVNKRFGRRDSALWDMVTADCEEADALLVNSDLVKNSLITNGINAEKIFVVYWGIDNKLINVKKNYEISRNVKILFTGHFGIRKGCEEILRAVKDVNEQVSVNVKINHAGKVTDYGKKAIKRIGSKYFDSHGFVGSDKMRELMKESDLFALPTYAEGCSRSVMEALGSGLPVITTEMSGAPVEDEINSRVVEPGSVDDLTDAIIGLCNDKPLREMIGKRASKEISEKYTWDNYKKEILNVYKSL